MADPLPLVFDAPRRGLPPRHFADLDSDGTRTTVLRADGSSVGVVSHAQSPGLVPQVRRVATDPGGPSVAVLLPHDDGWSVLDPGSTNGTTINYGDEPIARGRK